MVREIVDRIEPLAVVLPIDVGDIELRPGEDLFALLRFQIVYVDNRLDLVVEGVTQAALVDRDGVFAVGRDRRRLNTVAVGRDPLAFLGLFLDIDCS